MVQTAAFRRLALIVILVGFSVLGFSYLSSDFWLDEMITVVDYGSNGNIGTIFRHYPVANNHILYSAVLWVWLNLMPDAREVGARLPCFVMAVATLCCMYLIGRSLIDRAAGFFMALLMGFSPIYLGFFYQMRGYGLAMLLGSCATLGALWIAEGRRCRGACLYGPAVLLLPGVLPTNILLNTSLWLFLASSAWRFGTWRRDRLLLLFLGIVSIAGMGIYLPVWDQFQRVAEGTQGWESGPLVAGHWLLALVVHAGLFLVVCWWLKRNAAGAGRTEVPVHRHLPLLAASCLGILLTAALLFAMFPRSLLGYLAPLNVCALYGYRPSLARHNAVFFGLVAAVLLNTLIGTHLAELKTGRDLAAGRYPQNLLQQFYSRRNDLSRTLRHIKQHNLATGQSRLLIPYHLHLVGQVYWQQEGGDSAQVRCLSRGPAAAAVGPGLLLAYNLDQALDVHRQSTGISLDVKPLYSPTALEIYRDSGRDPE